MSASTSTMIEIRDYVTNFLYIRRPSSGLGDYNALVSNCFNYSNWNRENYTVHFHFQRDSYREDGKLLREDEWAVGSYEVLFAHFVRRARATSQNSLSFEYRTRKSTTPPDIPSPKSPWTQPPLPAVDDQGFPMLGDPPVRPVPDASTPGPTPAPPPAPLQPRPAARRPAIQRRNTNSTTVYSMGPPIPTSHYSSTYFSGPYVFIPLRPSLPRPRSHAQRYSDPFPGFTTQSSVLASERTTTATASAPHVRKRPSVQVTTGGRSLASQPQSDDGFPDRPPVTRRGRPRTGEQTVQPRPLLMPSYFGADNSPVASQQSPTEQELYEDEPEQGVPETTERASVESSLESFDFSDYLYGSPEASQHSPPRQQEQGEQQEQEGTEGGGRASVARSQDSFGQFTTERIESPLFVTDESDRDFQEDLAWETDDEQVAVGEKRRRDNDNEED